MKKKKKKKKKKKRFQSICIPTGRSFEWYTGPSEVERILQLHFRNNNSNNNSSNNNNNNKNNYKNMNNDNDDETSFDQKRIIHPGSGNSLLPIYLRDKYSTLYQYVVDCSEVAIMEMKSRHDQLYKDYQNDNHPKQSSIQLSTSKSCRIDYLVEDLLSNDSLSNDVNQFHAWVDKGFIDALFSSFDDESQKTSCRQLFEKANRILTSPSTSQNGGICVVVTLAQEHSLQLMLDSIDYINYDKKSNESTSSSSYYYYWKPIIHIHELEPLQKGASSLCPFAFVFEKSNTMDPKTTPFTVIFHCQNKKDEYIHCTMQDTNHCTCASLFHDIHKKLETIRMDFAKRQNENNTQKQEIKRLVLTTLEIKPSCDFEMSSLDDLSNKITMCPDYKKTFTSLTWRNSTIVPIGFGISKLAMECLIDSEQVEDLCEFILDTEGEDVIQSIDINWDATVPVGDAMSCLQKSK